ncbi:MAG: DUF2961 domain-containing protein [Gemmatimonadaceae bacterium]
MRPSHAFLALATAACAASSDAGDRDFPTIARMPAFSAQRSSSNNRFVLSNEDNKHFMPGETIVIADLDGPGAVTHLWFTAAANEFAWPRLFRLRVYYDGKKTPSVDAPLGDFFGVGHGYETDLNSAMIYNTSLGRGRNSYWQMPFRKHCRITITNEGARMKALYYQVDWRKYQSLPNDVLYFHAYYRQELPAVSGHNYSFLNIHGKGQYVGTVLNVVQTQISWFGEGDDLFYVDGAAHPQLFGTGSEDYFNEAWGLRQSSGPWTGSVVAEGERIGSRLSGYRWHVPDAIPFTKSIWAGIEHRGWTYNPDGSTRAAFEERPDYFSSVAYWYQDGVNEELPEPPYGSARLPMGNAQQIAIQHSIRDVTAVSGTASVQKGQDWNKDFVFLAAKGPGARINIPFDVAESGRYELVASIAKAPNYGNYVALVDNQPTNLDLRQPVSSEIPFPGPLVYHNYELEVYAGMQQPLGFFRFEKGRHSVSLICVGKDVASAGYDVGVYELVLERLPENIGVPDTTKTLELPPALPDAPRVSSGSIVYRGQPLDFYVKSLGNAHGAPRADALRAIGSFGDDARSAVPAVTEGLRDADLEVRVAAAWALTQIGPPAATATTALATALADSSARVRVLAALALKSIGAAASGALPPLIGALADPDEHVRVSAAAAIGTMGPAAKSAVKPLADRMFVKDELRNVIISAATALGQLGPTAAEALPALEQAFKAGLVGPSAQEAMHKIRGEPVQSWW